MKHYTIALIPIPELSITKANILIGGDLIFMAGCILPGESNPLRINLHVVITNNKPAGAVFAPDGQTALEWFAEFAPQYDASQIMDCLIRPADLRKRRSDCELLIDLAEARGASRETLVNS
jgi:hypothetical protein